MVAANGTEENQNEDGEMSSESDGKNREQSGQVVYSDCNCEFKGSRGLNIHLTGKGYKRFIQASLT